MRKVIIIVATFLVFHTVLPVYALQVQKNDLPRSFMSKTEGSVTIRKEGESITVRSNRSTLEEILEKLAMERKATLNFYCQDPALKIERPANLTISGDSVTNVLGKLMSDGYKFQLLDREGKPIEDGKDIAVVNIYSKGCAGTDPPVRTFIAEREHPLLRKPPEEISLEELGAVLKSGGPAFRRRAADILGMKADEKGIPYAKEALKDENAGVMLAATNALKKLGQKHGGEKVAGAIYDRFREKPYAEFLLALATVDRSRIWSLIDALMDQSGEKERGVIIRALFGTNDRRATKYLSRLSSTGSVENSRQAIYGLGKLGGSEAVTALMKLLRGGDAQRQACAAQAVYFLSKADGLEARAEVEKIAKQEKVSDTFLQALAEISYLEPLEKLMKDPALKGELKIRALRALAIKGDERNIKVISMAASDKSAQVRLACVEAVGTIGSETAIPYLVKAAEDKDANVRKGAIRALADIPGDERILVILSKALNDTNENVRRAAVDAIKLQGEPNEAMTAVLRNCKSHKDPYVAEKAASILKVWGLE